MSYFGNKAGWLAFATLVFLSGGVPAGENSPNPEKRMYGLIGKVTAVAGERDKLIAILLEGVNQMPGCLSYVVAKDAASADALWISEVWDNKRSHEASLAIPAVRQRITRGKLLIAKFDQSTVIEPVGGHGLAPTNKP